MLELSKLKGEQLKLAKKIIIKDSFDKLELIGGAEQSYTNYNLISAITVCDYKTMEIIEKSFAVVKVKVPYISGFLAYREGQAISEAYSKLESKPDVMLFKGNGILHPRGCGLASHIGVILDQASIGIANHLLAGEVRGNKVYVDKELRGEIVITKEHSKPVYVSPGHKVSLKTSVEIVKKCVRLPHKMPEPLHLAHRYSREILEEVSSGAITV